MLSSWVSGCATMYPGPRRENFAPLFLYSEDAEREGKALDVLGPFFTYRKDGKEKDVAFRPFFYWEKEEGQSSRLEYLYPLGDYKRTNTEVESSFTLFYSTRRDLTKETPEKKERTFLLAIWGETEKGERYGGFFPIYGNLKNRFGREEINFFLWPVYSRSREGENRTYSFLWPIFSYSEGGGRESFKVWPLAGYDRKENDYEKTFFLWPFFDFEKRALYTDSPTQVTMIMPLYVSMSSTKQVYRSVLWPFFTYNYDEETRYTQWDLPWPFYQRGQGEGRSFFHLFPFYRRKQSEGLDAGYIFLPFYMFDHEYTDKYDKRVNRYLLLSKDHTEIWKEESKKERRVRIWPLFYYRQKKDGSAYAFWPVIIPVDFEGFERNWVPLLSLYEYRRTPLGVSESRFLWGFYLNQKSPAHNLYELSFLFTRYAAKDLSYFCLLRGLLEYRSEGPTNRLRLLYSPWPIRWESSPDLREAVSARDGIQVESTPKSGG